MDAQQILLRIRPEAEPNVDYWATGDTFKWTGRGDPPTKSEMADAWPAVQEALQAEEAKRIESHAARDDAKRALVALDTIIAGAPTATNAQMRTWIEQLARISKHHILATVGR